MCPKEREWNTVFLDAGHGKIDPTTGIYTTAPSKQFNHYMTGKEYHNNGWFYEGVKNQYVIDKLKPKLEAKGIEWIQVNHPWKDTPLHNRVLTANTVYASGKKGFYFSEHSNATPQHTARGFSAWTSVGQTRSDVLADFLYQMYENEFKEEHTAKHIKSVKNITDGDADWEANFYVLANTVMPAVLAENLFFDQEDDADYLVSEEYIERYTTMLAEWIDKSLDFLSGVNT